MDVLIVTYLIFIIAVGVIHFSIKYIRVEKRIVDWKEFLLLICFPIIGFGNWKYNRAIRLNGKTELPKRWFIWKYMIPLNKWFIIISAIALTILTVTTMTSDLFGGHTSTNNLYSGVLDIFGDIFIGLIILMILGSLFTGLIILGLILILIPKSKVKSIERDFYKNNIN